MVAPAENTDALIEVQNLSVLRRNAEEKGSDFVLALDRFEAGAGSRIGLVGRSGSGKSTALEALGLLVWPEQVAQFVIRNTDMTRALSDRDTDWLASQRAKHIGFVPQEAGLLPYLTVRENALLAARLADEMEGAEARLRELADGIGLGHLLDRLPERLSGGEKQRAAVLRGMMSGASVILADEPTAALDDQTSAELMQTITELGERFGIALICASHDEALLAQYGFTIHRIRHIQDGTRVVAVLEAET